MRQIDNYNIYIILSGMIYMFAVKLIVLTGFAVRPFHPIELINFIAEKTRSTGPGLQG